jgi:hypothetical protein
MLMLDWTGGKAGETTRPCRDAMQAALKAVRMEVAGPNPTPLERLLAERVGLCWQRTTFLDALLSSASQMPGGVNHRTVDLIDRQLSRSQRRLVEAVKALADVRRVGPKLALQVNIANLKPGTQP